MTFWTAENLKSAMGGMWLARAEGAISGISTDTRTLKRGQVFIAIKGENFDGHSMLSKAAGAGSPLAVIDSEEAVGGVVPRGMGVLKVGDTRRALLRLAGAYRKTLERTRVIAVCGSNGKTTTVRLLSAALSSLKGTASPKSFNNEIGVPLTILGASPADQYLICEVGTNAPGEVATLSEVVRPDIALITSIGREHLEKLGSVAGVAREEASVLEELRPGGAGIFTADSEELREVVGAMGRRAGTAAAAQAGPAMISFGFADDADVRVVSVKQALAGVRFTLNDRAEFAMPILGRHNAANAAGAVAAARRMGVSDVEIARGLAGVKGEAMRLEVVRRGGVTVINDAYNANPDSMRASLETFDEVSAKAARRVVVLGDMFELGEESAAFHAEVVGMVRGRSAGSNTGHSKAVSSGTIDLVVLVGEQMKAAGKGLKAVFVPDMDEKHAAEVAGLLRDGDMVLLKASRRMRLERLLAAMPEPVGAA